MLRAYTTARIDQLSWTRTTPWETYTERSKIYVSSENSSQYYTQSLFLKNDLKSFKSKERGSLDAHYRGWLVFAGIAEYNLFRFD